jgi:phosphoribosylformylglycinamidine synthase
VVIGRVINESKMRVLEHGKVVAEIPNESLTDDAPLYHRPIGEWKPKFPREKPANISLAKENRDFTPEVKKLLASPNICSKRWVHEQYDTMVQTNTAQAPGDDAGVIRVKGTTRGLAMALDCNSRWAYLEPKLGAMHSVAEAARKVACAGAAPVAATNCLNFGNPEKPEIMAQFSAVIDGMTEACNALGTPITGGNVSFYNETLGEGIYPTPTVGIVGIMEDVTKVVSSHFQKAGEALLVLHKGGCSHTEQEFGSSEYAKELMGAIWGVPPALDLKMEVALQKCAVELADKRLISAAHDISEGGIAVALAEMGFRRNIGVKAEFKSPEWPPEMGLFAEHASHIFVTCDQSKVKDIQSIAVRYGLAADLRGQTQAENFEITYNGSVVVSAPVADLKKSWSESLEKMLHVETREHLVPEVLKKS